MTNPPKINKTLFNKSKSKSVEDVEDKDNPVLSVPNKTMYLLNVFWSNFLISLDVARVVEEDKTKDVMMWLELVAFLVGLEFSLGKVVSLKASVVMLNDSVAVIANKTNTKCLAFMNFFLLYEIFKK